MAFPNKPAAHLLGSNGEFLGCNLLRCKGRLCWTLRFLMIFDL